LIFSNIFILQLKEMYLELLLQYILSYLKNSFQNLKLVFNTLSSIRKIILLKIIYLKNLNYEYHLSFNITVIHIF